MMKSFILKKSQDAKSATITLIKQQKKFLSCPKACLPAGPAVLGLLCWACFYQPSSHHISSSASYLLFFFYLLVLDYNIYIYGYIIYIYT